MARAETAAGELRGSADYDRLGRRLADVTGVDIAPRLVALVLVLGRRR